MAFDGKLLSGVTVLMAVVEARSIARAAEALGLSPSGVSRALSRLGSSAWAQGSWHTHHPVTFVD